MGALDYCRMVVVWTQTVGSKWKKKIITLERTAKIWKILYHFVMTILEAKKKKNELNKSTKHRLWPRHWITWCECAPFCNTLQQTLRYANHIRSTLRNGFLSENINITDKQSKPGNTTIHNLECQHTRNCDSHPSSLTHSICLNKYLQPFFELDSSSWIFKAIYSKYYNFFFRMVNINCLRLSNDREFEMKFGLKSDNIFHSWIATGIIMIVLSISNRSSL